MKKLKEMSDKSFMRLVGAIGLALILLYAIGRPIEVNLTNERTYNHGVCTECGGHYEYMSTGKNFNSNHYYYKCDKCGNIIELIK